VSEAGANEPRWLTRELVDAIHDAQIARHGGLLGVNDENLVESALARPRSLFAYVGGDAARLAAAYAFGPAKHHGYRDGNKRTAFLACYTFLGLNGLELVVPEPEAVVAMLALATGGVDEEGFARWVRDHAVPFPAGS
jgi:death on curing protein